MKKYRKNNALKKIIPFLAAGILLCGCELMHKQADEVQETNTMSETTAAQETVKVQEKDKELESIEFVEQRVVEQTMDGWAEQENGVQYMMNGQYIVGWKKIDGNLYYFGLGGLRKTGDIYLGCQRFSFAEDGHLVAISPAENEMVYYTENAKYYLNNGNLYQENADGSQTVIFDWRNYGLNGYTDLSGMNYTGIMKFTINGDKIYGITSEGLIVGSLYGNDFQRIIIPGASDSVMREAYGLAADNGRLYYSLGIEGAGDYCDPYAGMMEGGNYQHWNVWGQYKKMQAAEQGFFGIKTIDEFTASMKNLIPCDRSLVLVMNNGETTLISHGVDEFFVCEDTIYYMTNGQLQQTSLTDILGNILDKNTAEGTNNKNFPTAEYYPYFLDDNVYLSGWDFNGTDLNPRKGYGYIYATKDDVINHGDYYEIINQKLEAAKQFDTDYGFKLPNGKYTTPGSDYLWYDAIYEIYNGSFYLTKDAVINCPVISENWEYYGNKSMGVEEYFKTHDSIEIGFIKGFDDKGYINYIYISPGG